VAARDGGHGARSANERDGERDQQRRRRHLQADPDLQPDPAGGDHQGADGDRLRRRGAEIAPDLSRREQRPDMTATVQSQGKVTQVLGPVVDVEFPPGDLPEIYTALRVTNPSLGKEEGNLVLEVAQHLGEATVATMPMDPTER